MHPRPSLERIVAPLLRGDLRGWDGPEAVALEERLDPVRGRTREDVLETELARPLRREADEVPEFIGSMVKNEQDMARVAEFFGLRRRRRR